MKACLSLLFCFLLILSMAGCGQQETQEPDTGAAGQPEEVADTTRLDSAAGVDSAAGMTEDTTASEEAAGE